MQAVFQDTSHLSPEKVVLGRVKDRNFAQLEGCVLAGVTRTEDSGGQADADHTTDEQAQDEF